LSFTRILAKRSPVLTDPQGSPIQQIPFTKWRPYAVRPRTLATSQPSTAQVSALQQRRRSFVPMGHHSAINPTGKKELLPPTSTSRPRLACLRRDAEQSRDRPRYIWRVAITFAPGGNAVVSPVPIAFLRRSRELKSSQSASFRKSS